MKQFKFTIKDDTGIHARPAGSLVKLAKEYSSALTLVCKDKKGDLKKLFSIMSLGVKCGDTVIVEAMGEDEEDAINALERFFQTNL